MNIVRIEVGIKDKVDKELLDRISDHVSDLIDDRDFDVTFYLYDSHLKMVPIKENKK